MRLLFLLPIALALPPLIFIPSFQGTLLSHIGAPLFLSPSSPSTFPNLYSALLNFSHTHPTRFVDYPAYLCPPHPHSHIGHCNPLPAKGPVSHLVAHLNRYGYSEGKNLHFVAYDWRLNLSQLRPSVSAQLEATLQGEPAVLVAHGYGCLLALDILSSQAPLWIRERISHLVCAAAPLAGCAAARQALVSGDGLLVAGAALRYPGPAANVRQSGRLNFGAMEFELGLKGRRKVIPDGKGPWGDKDDLVMGSKQQRVDMANAFGSLREMSKGWTGDVAVNVTCVVASGDGFVEAESSRLCGKWGNVEEVDATHFNLTALLGNVIKRFTEEHAAKGGAELCAGVKSVDKCSADG